MKNGQISKKVALKGSDMVYMVIRKDTDTFRNNNYKVINYLDSLESAELSLSRLCQSLDNNPPESGYINYAITVIDAPWVRKMFREYGAEGAASNLYDCRIDLV